ncbi:MAG TPA: VOC family protein [Syntrophorhabdales bacterium]|nr:VOC family protein [Syntrophorhabdales bacterium]
MKNVFVILSVLMVLAVVPALALAAEWAELAPPNSEGVAMGQLNYVVRDVQANKRFWICLGAVPGKEEGGQVFLKIHDVVISLTQGAPSGNSVGSVLDHVGFQVPDVHYLRVRMEALGYKTAVATTGTKPYTIARIAYIDTPDGERLEFLQDGTVNTDIVFDDGRRTIGKSPRPRMTVPIILHHVHFYVPESSVGEIKAWYIKHFGGLSSKRWVYEAVDLPGVNINISSSPARLAPTKGRALDHIGFEVKNLEAFCRKLEADGVKLDRPYTREPSGLATAYLTDPWGVSIGLTEGLGRY